MQILARLEEDNLLLFQAESLKLPQENGLATEIHEVLSPYSLWEYVNSHHVLMQTGGTASEVLCLLKNVLCFFFHWYSETIKPKMCMF